MEDSEKFSLSTESPDPLKNKTRHRAKKRRRESSGSTEDDVLPENTLEIEKNLHASAIKNNLDDISVKKILKKVVTNDHVLALVQLREEEELAKAGENVQPKLTRSKAKELMKASPKSAPWNLELTPIKHIPVKTRPEVKALIAQELPDDEDDEEYQPTHDEVASDDDHATCSDIDSQPSTPATSKTQTKASPKVVTDGPFKVPQETISQARRQLELEEEATIALRTRSKLSLSETPIEHIESSFVPPDDIPLPDVDDLWNDFLKECLDPASNARHEDDDEADPEYNVAADPDAVEEDEESLENSLIKISKKELNDLVTELFNVLPEPQLTPGLTNTTMNGNGNEVNKPWEGKQEPVSDEELRSSSACLVFERHDTMRVSIGKSELPDDTCDVNMDCQRESAPNLAIEPVTLTLVEEHKEIEEDSLKIEPPPAVQSVHQKPDDFVRVEIENNVITAQQTLLLQQQLRIHIQLAASNFLQLFVNPVHWTYAPKYKEYLESFNNMVQKDPNTIVNVCNFKPALELIRSWENTVSENTPDNKKLVEFMQEESEKCRRRTQNSGVYVGDFPELIKKVIANSSVFLYPFLLPPMPYRADEIKRRPCYLLSEDHLIVLGLEQFWSYVEANPKLFPPPSIKNSRYRWGISATINLICKYMFPWAACKTIARHISTVRKLGRKDHIINKFFASRHVEPTKHVLYPFNPNLTLYEQPEDEVPKLWVRYLAKNSKRFRVHLQKKRPSTYQAPAGVEVVSGENVSESSKTPLPIQFTQNLTLNRINCHPIKTAVPDKVDVNIQINKPLITTTSTYEVVETENGKILKPVADPPNNDIDDIQDSEPVRSPRLTINPNGHCTCCSVLKGICKYRQKRITEYMKGFNVQMSCPCRSIKHPKISNKLRILLNYYKAGSKNVFSQLQQKIEANTTLKKNVCKFGLSKELEENKARDHAFVSTFQIRLAMRENKARNQLIKRHLFTILSRFHPEEGDPIQLMNDIFKACEVDLVDMYKEFLGFLNPEQADKIDKFRDYFVLNCMEDLINKVEETVTDKYQKSSIFKYLMSLSRKNPLSCVICTELLAKMRNYPQLARYCFSLFPHQWKKTPQPTNNNIGKVNDTISKIADNYEIEKQISTERHKMQSLVRHHEAKSVELEKNVISNHVILHPQEDIASTNLHNLQVQETFIICKQSILSSNKETIIYNGDCVQPQDIKIDPSQEDIKSQAIYVTDINRVNLKDNSTSHQEKVPLQVALNQENVQPCDVTDNDTENEMEHEGQLRICEDVNQADVIDCISSKEKTAAEAENNSQSDPDGKMLLTKLEKDCTDITKDEIKLFLIPKIEPEDMDTEDLSDVKSENNDSNNEEITEIVKWKREEDKLILEVLQKHLTPKERKDKTISEIIEDKDIPQIITNVLVDKTLHNVRDRIFYLLQILIRNG